ncbi:MAG: serine dehydratase subunit alpha family protein [Tissierellia bacterium]|jgi:L-cysteine desulfidase|nr:serine dehydratase subunit alpha family protein [Tissierellia bacterium]
MLSEEINQKYIKLLEEELQPAMGCTEPIAVAYASALAKTYLRGEPERVYLDVSGNIIKNVKSVVVPNTGGLRGLEVSVAAGIVVGDASKKLRVIAEATPEAITKISPFLERVPVVVRHAKTDYIFDIKITLENSDHSSVVRIVDHHTNVVEIQQDGNNVEVGDSDQLNNQLSDRSFMSVAGIVEFADSVDIEEIRPVLERQIEYNSAISQEGMRGDYGANIGKVLLSVYGDEIQTRARAMAAAGSDARMNGCQMPVVINSGSGNQGIAASVPVIEYAKELGSTQEQLLRALAVSNLITIHMKTGIGRLSAYCGVVCAGCGSGAGIAHLQSGGLDEIAHTIVNAVAITSGIVCDGAKASCAAKISAAVDAGIMGYHMYKNGQQFHGGEGIVSKEIENTIINVGELARQGMAETDLEILRIMLKGD